MDLLEELRARGFIYQSTDDDAAEKGLEKLLREKRVTAYAGFDPTAASLHVGSLVPIMGLVHLQRAGHRPIAVVGGGTGLVGDPSGKTELRKLVARETIRENIAGIRAQLERFLDLEPGGAARPAGAAGARGLLVDNADWLEGLGYIEFLREIGRHFSVNRMLAAESVKLRLESEAGLSFLEFNYSILQAYDFFVLHRDHGCELQLGGSDQWGNIVAGIDLIRRVSGGRAHAVTFPLITTSDGRKMGKTEKGAVWLDAALTSPYDYYQFWINTADPDVSRFLRLFTLLPLEEIATLEKLQGADLRKAKEALAFEATTLNHGKDEAEKARDAARALFGGGDGSGEASAPTRAVPLAQLTAGIAAAQLFADSGLCESRGAARRMARQGGLYVNGVAIPEERVLTEADLQSGAILLRAGKKKHLRVVPEGASG